MKSLLSPVLLFSLFVTGEFASYPKIWSSSRCGESKNCHPLYALDSIKETTFTTNCGLGDTIEVKDKDGNVKKEKRKHWIIIELEKYWYDIRVEIIPNAKFPEYANHLKIGVSKTKHGFADGQEIDWNMFAKTCYNYDIYRENPYANFTHPNTTKEPENKDPEVSDAFDTTGIKPTGQKQHPLPRELHNYIHKKAKKRAHEQMQYSHARSKRVTMKYMYNYYYKYYYNYYYTYINGGLVGSLGGPAGDFGKVSFFGGTVYCKNPFKAKYVAIVADHCISVADINIYTGDAKDHCLQEKDQFGVKYRGYMYSTRHGIPCDSWEDPIHKGKYPQFKGPYCRNPADDASNRPWCYVKRFPLVNYTWDYCSWPPPCEPSFQLKISTRECIEAEIDPDGKHYLGHHYITTLPTCISWEATKKHRDNPLLEGPWCRNPGGRAYKPFCYYPDPKNTEKKLKLGFAECDIPKCT